MIWFLIRLPTKNLITNPILAELPIRRRNKLHTLLYHEQSKKKKKKKKDNCVFLKAFKVFSVYPPVKLPNENVTREKLNKNYLPNITS